VFSWQWDITQCGLADKFQHSAETYCPFCPENGASRFLLNIGTYLPVYTMLCLDNCMVVVIIFILIKIIVIFDIIVIVIITIVNVLVNIKDETDFSLVSHILLTSEIMFL
jgi:hypothetical protein